MANPVNRKEAILAGENVAPVTREEYFVKEAVSNGGGGGNPGYSVQTETVTIVPQQSVTTVDDEGSFYGTITLTNIESFTEHPESLQVVFNGVNYNCPKDGEMAAYGAHWDDSLNDGEGGMDWSEYPFAIFLGSPVSGEIETESAGTHTVYAYAEKSIIVTDETFNKAVTQVVSENTPRQIITVRLTLSGEKQILDSTYEQIWNYYSNQGLPVFISWVGFVCHIATGTRTIYVIERGPNGNITASFPFNASADDAYPERNVPSV